MSKRRLRPVLVLLLLGLLTATAFGVADGLASRKDDIPTLEKKLADCRKDVAYDREAIAYAESFLALAKRNQIVLLGFGALGPVITTVSNARDVIILGYVTGRITKAQFVRQLAALAVKARATLKTLTELVKEAREELDADQKRCAQLAKELAAAKKAGPPKPPAAGSFKLVPGLTEVKNFHGNLKMDAEARTAHVDQGNVTWDETWTIPVTITPGKESSVTLGLEVVNNGPKPCTGCYNVAMSVAASGGLNMALRLDISSQLKGGETYTWTVPEAFKDAPDLTVVIHTYESSSITYHYRK